MKKRIFLFAVVGILAGLMLINIMSGTEDSGNNPIVEQLSPAVNDSAASAELPSVRVRDLTAELMNDIVEVTGRTQASRQVNISSETEGQIASILIEKGDMVRAGQVLAKLEIRDRAARVSEAEQLLNQRQIQYNASKELAEKGFNSRVRLAEARAQLETARSLLKQARVELANVNIKAPFDGVINDQIVEIGDYVSKGQTLFNIVDLNPVEIVGFLTEKQMEHVTVGTQANAKLLQNQMVSGDITFIASAADMQTRTFKIEMTLPNSDHIIKEGMTAKIQIPVKEASAYKISPSILSLADDGTVGIKIVNAQDTVEFMPITLLKDTPEYLWVGGLPDKIRVITVGQEFVINGQKVKPVISEEAFPQ